MNKYIYNSILMLLFTGLGYLLGSTIVNNKYISIENEWKEEAARIKEEYVTLTNIHVGDQLLLQNELLEQTREYEKDINNIRSDHAGRMLNSEKRNSILRERAETSNPECRPITLHATRLDRSLEEGRGLVREFSRTLRQRELEINKVSNLLIRDRDHLNER